METDIDIELGEILHLADVMDHNFGQKVMSKANKLPSLSSTDETNMTHPVRQPDILPGSHSLQLHDISKIKFVNTKEIRLKPYKRITRKDWCQNGKCKWGSILNDWNLENPDLIISVIGDIKHSFKSRDFLKSCVMDCFRMTKNTWILTTAYDTELSGIISEAVNEIETKYNKVQNKEINVNTTVIGFATSKKVLGIENIETSSDYNTQMLKRMHRKLINTKNKKFFTLNEGITHFLLIDDWNEDPGKQLGMSTGTRSDMMMYFKVPRANLVLGGGDRTINFLLESLENNIPGIMIEQSGGLVDSIIPYVRQLKEQFKDTKGSVSPEMSVDLLQLIPKHIYYRYSRNDNKLLRCLSNFQLISICDPHHLKNNEILETLLKPIMNKSGRPLKNYAEKMLMLCLDRNCTNLFKQTLKETFK